MAKPMGKAPLKARLKNVAREAYENIKETTSKLFKIQAVKEVFKKLRKDNAKEAQQGDIHATDQLDEVNNLPDPQTGSIFYKIPQEIRNEIYFYFFSSSRVQFEGSAAERRPEHERQRHPLALLASCRRIRTEVGLLWLELIDLHFASPEIMLRKLLTIPAPLSSVRYVQVHDLMGAMTAVRTPSRPQAEVLLHEFLRVLEGLRLEELVVIGGLGYLYHEHLAVDLLVTRSNGWRRLVVAFERSHLLDPTPFNVNAPDHQIDCYGFVGRYGLQGYQPEAYMEAFQHRDGAQSPSSLRIEQGSPWPCRDLTGPRIPRAHSHHSIPSPLPCRNVHPPPRVNNVWRKPLKVLAERGRGVDYTVPPLRLGAREHWPYWQTKERILKQSAGTGGLRHRKIDCDDKTLIYGWDQELHSTRFH